MVAGFCLHDELMLLVNVRRIHAVVMSGRLLDRAQLDATLSAVRTQFQTQRPNPRPQ
jgi:hypothetical protein